MGCSQHRERLSAFVDNELDTHEVLLLNHHLRSCATCRQQLESLRTVQVMIRKVSFTAPMPIPSTQFSKQLLASTADAEPAAPVDLEPEVSSRWRAACRSFVNRAGFLTVPRLAASFAGLLLVAGVLLMYGGSMPWSDNLTTVYELGNKAHAAAALAENDLEDTLLEFAYSSSTGPSLGNGAWVSFTRVRLGD